MEGFVALVEALSVQNPVVLVVEDLQWADPSALLVLHRLARRVGQLPLLLAYTVRPVPRPAELEGANSWVPGRKRPRAHGTLGGVERPRRVVRFAR